MRDCQGRRLLPRLHLCKSIPLITVRIRNGPCEGPTYSVEPQENSEARDTIKSERQRPEYDNIDEGTHAGSWWKSSFNGLCRANHTQ